MDPSVESVYPNEARGSESGGENLVVILNEYGREPTIRQRPYRRILRDGARDAKQKVRQRVARNFRSDTAVCRRAAVKGVCSVVVQQRVLDVLLKRTLSTELE